MSGRLKTLPELKGEQAQASDPRVHAALSASAGTGKTQVLTARVLRLLLQGARPESILCLTFTKAAAAEMANRIGARLAAWVRLKDTELGQDLIHLGERNDSRNCGSARGSCSLACSTAPAGSRSRLSTPSRSRFWRRFRRRPALCRGSSRSKAAPSRNWCGARSPSCWPKRKASSDERLIADVQRLSRRLGEAGAIEYLQICARRAEAMAALGPAERIEPRIRELLQLPADTHEDSVEDYIATHCGDDQLRLRPAARRR